MFVTESFQMWRSTIFFKYELYAIIFFLFTSYMFHSKQGACTQMWRNLSSIPTSNIKLCFYTTLFYFKSESTASYVCVAVVGRRADNLSPLFPSASLLSWSGLATIVCRLRCFVSVHLISLRSTAEPRPFISFDLVSFFSFVNFGISSQLIWSRFSRSSTSPFISVELVSVLSFVDLEFSFRSI